MVLDLRLGHLRPAHALALVLACSILFMSGCSEERRAGKPVTNAPEQEDLIRERIEKDEAFKSDGSPIPANERPYFKGLSYYPVNPKLRFTVQLKRHSTAVPVRLATNTGEIRSGLRYGYFDFEVDGRACRLQVYRLDDAQAGGGASLFIPFRDATSGAETYGPGRYIDLKENTSGVYVLDFNRAYNPYCAYNPEYSCPIPPQENNLDVPIEGGERSQESGDRRKKSE